MRTDTEGQGKAAPVLVKENRPTPNEKTLLVCRPGGKWSEEVIA